MTPETVRKLCSSLTRGLLGLAPDAPMSKYLIAKTIHSDLGVSHRAVMAWLGGEYLPSKPAAKLLNLLARP